MNLKHESVSISGLVIRGVVLRKESGIPSVFSSNYIFPPGESTTQGQIIIYPNVIVEVPPGSIWNLQP